MRGRLDASAKIDAAALVKAGILRRAKDGVRLLGEGELKAKIDVVGVMARRIGGRRGGEGRRHG